MASFPKFGPKQAKGHEAHAIGIGGGPPRGGGKNNRKDDTGEHGEHDATEGKTKRAKVTAIQLPNNGPGAKVKGQSDQDKTIASPTKREPHGEGKEHPWHKQEDRHGGMGLNAGDLGEHGRHSSLKGYR